MTREEAIITLTNTAFLLRDGTRYMKPEHEKQFREAYEMAIKALTAQSERGKGKWIKKMQVAETEKYISCDPEWYCACCGAIYDSHIAKIVNFCYVCGADMRGEQE